MTQKQIEIHRQETGRSMTEMLGVLAVIGILSIGGIIGYRNAMDKSKANDIIDGVSKRAMVLSQKAMLGRTIDAGSLDADFGSDRKIAGYDMTLTGYSSGKGYDIKVSAIPEGVCDKLMDQGIKSASAVKLGTTVVWNNGDQVEDDYDCGEENAVTYEFNALLDETDGSGKGASDIGNQTECVASGYRWCTNGTYVNTCQTDCCAGVDTTCKTCDSTTGIVENKADYFGVCTNANNGNGYCVNGVCKMDSCFSNADCGSRQYCKYGIYYKVYTTGDVVTATGTADGQKGGYQGVCTGLGGSKTGTQTKYMKSADKMNWWSAKNWCTAQDRDLLDISDKKLKCYSGTSELNFPSGEGYCCVSGSSGKTCTRSAPMQLIQGDFGTCGRLWTNTEFTANPYNGNAYWIGLVYGASGYVSSSERFTISTRTADYFALCK